MFNEAVVVQPNFRQYATPVFTVLLQSLAGQVDLCIPSGSLNISVIFTKLAEIWSPGTFFEDVWTHKISALYHLYFQSYETFSEIH